jgi:hypothetical protein
MPRSADIPASVSTGMDFASRNHFALRIEGWSVLIAVSWQAWTNDAVPRRQEVSTRYRSPSRGYGSGLTGAPEPERLQYGGKQDTDCRPRTRPFDGRFRGIGKSHGQLLEGFPYALLGVIEQRDRFADRWQHVISHGQLLNVAPLHQLARRRRRSRRSGRFWACKGDYASTTIGSRPYAMRTRVI